MIIVLLSVHPLCGWLCDVLAALSTRVDFLLLVYLPVRPQTSVEELIVITYL